MRLDSSRSTSQNPTTSRRAYNIAQRNVWIGRTLIATYFVVLVVRHYRFSSPWLPSSYGYSSSGPLSYTNGSVSKTTFITDNSLADLPYVSYKDKRACSSFLVSVEGALKLTGLCLRSGQVRLVPPFAAAVYSPPVLTIFFSCVIGTPHPDRAISAWSFYLSAMSFDFLALSISTYYLLKAQATSASA